MFTHSYPKYRKSLYPLRLCKKEKKPEAKTNNFWLWKTVLPAGQIVCFLHWRLLQRKTVSATDIRINWPFPLSLSLSLSLLLSLYTHIYLSLYIYLYWQLPSPLSLSLSLYIYIYIYMFLFIHTRVHTHTHIYIHTYIYIYSVFVFFNLTSIKNRQQSMETYVRSP